MHVSAPTVLLVDDDPLFRWSIAETLTVGGHEVTQVDNPGEGIAAIENASRPFDVLLVAHRQPDATQLKSLSQMRDRSPAASTVLMTPFSTPDVARQALALGACHVITMPCDMREIGRIVRVAQVHQHTIACGDHVCAMLSSIDEMANLAAEWIGEGLRRGERCWFVAAGDEAAAIRAALESRNVDFDAEVRRNALKIVPATETYLIDGTFNPQRTIEIFRDTVQQAMRDGFEGFRAAADMSWALEIADGPERVVEYEGLLKSLFASHRLTGLCLYHRDRMPSKTLEGALATHPVIGVDGGRFAVNPFYRLK